MKLYLSNHPQFRRQWLVRGMRANWRPPFEGVISSFDSVGPFGWKPFEERCEQVGAEIVWKDDPDPIFSWLESLNDDPGVEVKSGMPNTYKGFFPFQIQGINFMAGQSGLLEWSTGTGKTLGLEGILLKNLEAENFDLYLTVVKRNNKTNTKRKFLNQAGIDSVILDGDHDKREELYIDLFERMQAGAAPTAILNYEKFREDEEAFMLLVEGKRVFVAWDEMSDKLKNRETQLWRSISKIFFTSFTSHKDKKTGNMKNIFYPSPDPRKWRTEFHQFLGMTATPVINSPQDYINIIHMLDPTVFGSIREAENLFVARRHKTYRHPVAWKDLDRLEQMTAHVVHQVDKDDPDIAQFFPKVVPDDVWIDLDPADRAIYDVLADEYKKMRQEQLSILSENDILAAIGVLGMICSNPLSVVRSAEMRDEFDDALFRWHNTPEARDPASYEEAKAEFIKNNIRGSKVAQKLVALVGKDKFTDKHCAKLEMLEDDLLEHRGKATVFTKANESLVPFLSKRLDAAGIEHVLYTGGMTDKALQKVQDEFRSGDAKVFLSSDAGSDSIDLPESSLCIHYDLPPTHARLVQRQNRQHRITSEHESVWVKTYLVADTVEERFMEIILDKKWYADQTTGGAIKDQAQALRKSDLLYILTGERFSADV